MFTPLHFKENFRWSKQRMVWYQRMDQEYYDNIVEESAQRVVELQHGAKVTKTAFSLDAAVNNEVQSITKKGILHRNQLLRVKRDIEERVLQQQRDAKTKDEQILADNFGEEIKNVNGKYLPEGIDQDFFMYVKPEEEWKWEDFTKDGYEANRGDLWIWLKGLSLLKSWTRTFGKFVSADTFHDHVQKLIKNKTKLTQLEGHLALAKRARKNSHNILARLKSKGVVSALGSALDHLIAINAEGSKAAELSKQIAVLTYEIKESEAIIKAVTEKAQERKAEDEEIFNTKILPLFKNRIDDLKNKRGSLRLFQFITLKTKLKEDLQKEIEKLGGSYNEFTSLDRLFEQQFEDTPDKKDLEKQVMLKRFLDKTFAANLDDDAVQDIFSHLNNNGGQNLELVLQNRISPKGLKFLRFLFTEGTVPFDLSRDRAMSLTGENLAKYIGKIPLYEKYARGMSFGFIQQIFASRWKGVKAIDFDKVFDKIVNGVAPTRKEAGSVTPAPAAAPVPPPAPVAPAPAPPPAAPAPVVAPAPAAPATPTAAPAPTPVALAPAVPAPAPVVAPAPAAPATPTAAPAPTPVALAPAVPAPAPVAPVPPAPVASVAAPAPAAPVPVTPTPAPVVAPAPAAPATPTAAPAPTPAAPVPVTPAPAAPAAPAPAPLAPVAAPVPPALSVQPQAPTVVPTDQNTIDDEQQQLDTEKNQLTQLWKKVSGEPKSPIDIELLYSKLRGQPALQTLCFNQLEHNENYQKLVKVFYTGYFDNTSQGEWISAPSFLIAKGQPNVNAIRFIHGLRILGHVVNFTSDPTIWKRMILHFIDENRTNTMKKGLLSLDYDEVKRLYESVTQAPADRANTPPTAPIAARTQAALPPAPATAPVRAQATVPIAGVIRVLSPAASSQVQIPAVLTQVPNVSVQAQAAQTSTAQPQVAAPVSTRETTAAVATGQPTVLITKPADRLSATEKVNRQVMDRIVQLYELITPEQLSQDAAKDILDQIKTNRELHNFYYSTFVRQPIATSPYFEVMKIFLTGSTSEGKKLLAEKVSFTPKNFMTLLQILQNLSLRPDIGQNKVALKSFIESTINFNELKDKHPSFYLTKIMEASKLSGTGLRISI